MYCKCSQHYVNCFGLIKRCPQCHNWRLKATKFPHVDMNTLGNQLFHQWQHFSVNKYTEKEKHTPPLKLSILQDFSEQFSRLILNPAVDWWLVESDQPTAHLSRLSSATIPQIYSPTSIRISWKTKENMSDSHNKPSQTLKLNFFGLQQLLPLLMHILLLCFSRSSVCAHWDDS